MTATDQGSGFDSTLEISDGRFHQLLGPEPEPGFFDPAELERTWGRRWGAADEVGRLRSALVRSPGEGLADIRADAYDADLDALVDPDRRWYWTGAKLPDLDLVRHEHGELIAALTSEGVEVVTAGEMPRSYTKSVYTRDPLVTVPGGAVIGRMAARVRRGEEQSIAQTVANVGMPILGTITGTGLAEGGSFQKVRPNLAIFGTSVRCNPEGYRQLSAILAGFGIEVRRVMLPGYLIHLDMAASMLDDDLAIVNPRLAPYDYMEQLRELGIEMIMADRREEWAVNLLTLDRRRVLLPDHFPRTAELLEKHGVTVVPVSYRELLKNGGSVHCSTMELQRDW